MAKKSHDNDEYLFTDLDNVDHESLNEEQEEEAKEAPSRSSSGTMRKAIVVLVIIGLLMLGYKFFGAFLESPQEQPNTTADTRSLVDKTVAIQSMQAPAKSIPPMKPITPIEEPKKPVAVLSSQPKPAVEVDTSFKQKLSAMEITQGNMRTELGNLNAQMSGMSNNINELNNKIQQLGEMVKSLTEKLEQEKMAIIHKSQLEKSRMKPLKVERVRVTKPVQPYYIQALVPGRAWLISLNGSTLSVREGSLIQGYGRVQLIDVNKGLVLTSSGRAIRFSQQDS